MDLCLALLDKGWSIDSIKSMDLVFYLKLLRRRLERSPLVENVAETTIEQVRW